MTNSDIKKAAFDIIKGEFPEADFIAWPGCKFTPPGIGQWLEVLFFPNAPLDNGLRYSDKAVSRGILQVTAMARSGGGSLKLADLVSRIHAAFPKGKTITGPARVVRHPYDMEFEADGDRAGIAVTVEYSC